MISKEHKLAIKISFLLFVFWFLITYFLPYLNHSLNLNIKNWYSRYIVFFSFLFLTYIFSYILSKFTLKPIEENNKLLKEYNHNLAHELKTPLSVIKSNLELLEIKYDKKLIESSNEEIEDMKNVIDSLLFLSESSSYKTDEMFSLYTFISKYNDKTIIINKVDDFILYWDKVLFSILFTNLIENALKYRVKNTNIVIKIDLNSFYIENIYKWEISNPDKLLDAFYQEDKSRNTKWFWLWLSIVKKISDIYNLKLIINSKNSDFEISVKK